MAVSILFADVVGYAGLMEQAEEETHVYVSFAIGQFSKLGKRYGGRVRQVQGDGLVMEFSAAAAALRFAVAIQQELARSDLELSNGERILFRIGIHTGSVLKTATGILAGHTINLCARVEEKAEPGGICLTQQTIDAIPQRLLNKYRIIDQGYSNFKTINTPIRLYSVAIDAGSAEPVARLVQPAVNANRDYDRPPSVVVCPFYFLDDPAKQHLLAHAVTEELVFQFSRRSEFFLHSPGVFADDQPRIELFLRLCRLFNIDYMVDGLISRETAGFRVRVRLTRTFNGQVINISQYLIRHDQKSEDIASGALKITLQAMCNIVSFESSGLNYKQKRLGRYQRFLVGQRLAHTLNEQANQKAIALLKRLVDTDDEYAPALVELARARHMAWRYDWGPNPGAQLARAIEDAGRATAIDPQSAQAYSELGFALIFADDIAASRTAFDTAHELNPADPWVLASIADLNIYTGNHKEAVRLAEQSLAMNKVLYSDWRIWSLAEAYFFMDDYENVVKHVARMRDWTQGSRLAAASLGLLGRKAEAQKYVRRIREIQPDFSISRWAKKHATSGAAHMRSQLLIGLSKVGLPK